MIPYQTLNGAEISISRAKLLAAVEQVVKGEHNDLSRRGVENSDFHYYAGFFSAPVFGLINWEQISRADLRSVPGVKAYFCAALFAARQTRFAHFTRDKNLPRGNRSFGQVSSAELATNVLPRLENILNCWGIAVDEDSGLVTERELSEEESARLTRYFHAPL